MFSTPEKAIAYTREEGVKFIDARFYDLPGVMQYFSIPVDVFRNNVLTEGLTFDGSSIRGFRAIHESDMKLVLDVTLVYVDPFRTEKILAMNFSIVDPFTSEPYPRDPRNIARRAEEYPHSTGTTDTVYLGAEAEFYVFDDIHFDSQVDSSFCAIDSEAGWWDTGRDEAGTNLGYRMRLEKGYFLVSPNNHFYDLRDAISVRLADVGLKVGHAHHEVGTGGQREINHTFSMFLVAVDNPMEFKYIIKSTAFEHGRPVIFMPKPLFGDNGFDIHCHQPLWKSGVPFFADERGYRGLSDMTRWYIGGLLEHALSLLIFINPLINSFHRLVPGFETPVNLVYSARNCSAYIRTSVIGSSAKAKRVEYWVPNPSANPYLAFAARPMVGLDGIKNRTELAEPIDRDPYEFPPEEHALIDQLPGFFEDALHAFEAGHDYLLEGDVFTEGLIRAWIDYKTANEIAPMCQRPHPYEFAFYYDI